MARVARLVVKLASSRVDNSLVGAISRPFHCRHEEAWEYASGLVAGELGGVEGKGRRNQRI